MKNVFIFSLVAMFLFGSCGKQPGNVTNHNHKVENIYYTLSPECGAMIKPLAYAFGITAAVWGAIGLHRLIGNWGVTIRVMAAKGPIDALFPKPIY